MAQNGPDVKNSSDNVKVMGGTLMLKKDPDMAIPL